jgi:uncharacterized protein YceK
MKNVKVLLMIMAVSLFVTGCGVVSQRTMESAAYDAGYYIGSQIIP